MARVSIAALDSRFCSGCLLAQQKGQIGRGPELPFFRDADKGYARLS